MALPRFFTSLPVGHPALQAGSVLQVRSAGDFDAQLYHHAVNVLRLQAGERVELVQRDLWQTWLCQIGEINPDLLHLQIVESVKTSDIPFELTLVIGFSKGDTTETVVRQATELGATRIVPVLFDRSISRPVGARADAKIVRLNKVAVAAAQQSHRTDLPVLDTLYSFSTAIKLLEQMQPDAIFTLWEEAERTDCNDSSTLSSAIAAVDLPSVNLRKPHLALVIGPEGGITAAEVEKLTTIGSSNVSLGSTILRVDTAACAAVAVACDALSLRSRLKG
ncbi:MAG: 16S rRNA (uracil(1498)-N(3))-methyltransferase [Coriobacteriia bacterium]|nr:16S rRNA (uracil(1498)-N(3))-methyltransferase [Coriobacteriia bacterium]